jgi:hypothetical protein
MDWWKEFPGWLVTTLLAFLAFAVVAWQEVRRRLLLPKVHWEGSYSRSPIGNGRGFERFLLRNKGDIDALDVMVLPYNCSIPGPNPGHLIGIAKVMESEPVELESVNEDSYVLISWRSPHHRARTLITWLPVVEGTELAAHHWEQKTWPWYKTWWSKRGRRGAVGPGTTLQSWLSRHPRKMARIAKKHNVAVPNTKR